MTQPRHEVFHSGVPAASGFRPLCVHSIGEGYVIVDKPAGLPSVPRRGADTDPLFEDSVQSRVRATFDGVDGPISVHRLDVDTSGLIVAALDRETHRALSRQFMHRKVGKSYTAVLIGHVADDEGAIDLPLIVDWPNRPRQMVCYENGKPGRTLYRVIDRYTHAGEARTRIDFRPVTGRTHQLRVHAATPVQEGGLGCPIAGDTLYGNPERVTTEADRLLLHADHLSFWEPGSGDWMKYDSPAPF